MTSKEAQLFGSVYNEYSEKLEKLRKDRRKQLKIAKENMDSISEKELETLVYGE